MEIRRPRTQAVERHIHVAICLAKVAEPPPVAGAESSLVRGEFAGVGFEPVAVGPLARAKDFDFGTKVYGEGFPASKLRWLLGIRN